MTPAPVSEAAPAPALEPPAAAGSAPRPRFLLELAVVPFRDELLVDGADHIQILEGEATQSVLPRLIALMDGSRTLEQLEAAFPELPKRRVREAVSFLRGRGLVEEGSRSVAIEDPGHAATLAFCRRFVAATGVNRSGAEAFDKLRAAEIAIADLGPTPDAAHVLHTLLSKTGFLHVTTLAGDALGDWGRRCAPTDVPRLVVSLAFEGEDHDRASRLHDQCLEWGVGWLRAVLDEEERYADIGPLFGGPCGVCYECFHAIHGVRRGARSGARAGHASEFWASMVAVEVAYQASRIGPTLAGRGFRRYDLGSWRSSDLRCASVPGCARCRPPLPGQSSAHEAALLETAVVFEDLMALPSRALLDPRPERDRLRLGASLVRQAKRVPLGSRVPLGVELPPLELGSLDALRGEAVVSSEPLSVDEAGVLLRLTAGIREARGPKLQRWAATAGNLGSVEAFLVARQVEGLAPGAYFYLPQEHALAALRRHQAEPNVDEFVARAIASLPQPAPDALVVLTAAFHRLARKYGPFAYRLANLDAGTALAQLHLAAQALRIRSQTLTRWADDVVEQQLELVPLEEQVTAVVALSRGEPQRRAAEVSLCAAPTAQPPRDARPARDFGQLSPGDVLELLYRESRVSESRLRQATGPVPPELRAIAPADFALTLPAPGRGGQPVGPLLRQRVTVRHYAKRQVPVEALGAMLHAAQAGDARDWPEEHDDDLGLGLEVLAAGVAGIAPGVYRYVAADHALRLDSPLPGREQLVDLLVQEEYASAPLLVLILGNLAAACRRHGAFGHRQLLLRAGAAGQRLWTAAMALGLAGSVFAGLVGGAARRRFGFDGYREAALFAFAAGHAASASSDSPT